MNHEALTLVLDQGTHASRAASIGDDGSVPYHRDLAVSMNRPGARREIGALTGLPLSAHYGANKTRWLIDNRADVADAAAQGSLSVGPLSSFILRHLLARLTGNALVGDPDD